MKKPTITIIDGKKDRYGSLEIDESTIDVENFTKQMEESLEAWEKDSVRGVWLKVSESNAKVVGDAVTKFGF